MFPKRKGEQCVTVSLAELLLLSKRAQKLSSSPLLLKRLPPGHHFSPLFGRGMEFAECRRYHEGDDIRSIDWRVTARTGKVHTKLFAAEKEREVLICVDMRSPMFFATRGVFKSVQACLMAGYLAWNAIQRGNRLGGVIFGDATQDEFRSAPGKKGVLPFLQSLAMHAARKSDPCEPSAMTGMDRMIERIKQKATAGSCVIVMSDFRRLSSVGHDCLIQLSTRCDLCLFFIYDPLESALPKNGLYPVTDGMKEWQLNTFDKKMLKRYQKQFTDRRDLVASLAKERPVQWMECSTEEDCFSLLQQHITR